MLKNVKTLISDIASTCLENNIAFKLENKHLVDEEELPCSGYFDEDSLVVATKKKNKMEWVSTLLHESCHMDQFLEKSKIYISDDCGLDIVEGWINNKKYSEDRVLKGFYNTILLELDCEIRTIKKIKKYKLPIKIDRYTQEANAYIFSYVYAYTSKKWYKAPYENKRIVNSMPKTFLSVDDYFLRYKEYKKFFIDS